MAGADFEPNSLYEIQTKSGDALPYAFMFKKTNEGYKTQWPFSFFEEDKEAEILAMGIDELPPVGQKKIVEQDDEGQIVTHEIQLKSEDTKTEKVTMVVTSRSPKSKKTTKFSLQKKASAKNWKIYVQQNEADRYRQPKPSIGKRYELSTKELGSSAELVKKIAHLQVNEGGGTGFFVSPQGHLITNSHVIDSNPDCLSKLNCKIKISIQQSDGNFKEVEAEVDVLVASKEENLDFALLKLKDPRALQFGYFKIQLSGDLGPFVSTLGYPSYKDSEGGVSFYDEALGKKLHGSSGMVLSYDDNSIKSSMAVSEGASGSPVFNSDTNELVGLVRTSDASKDHEISLGRAGFTAIFDMEYEYGISKYIDGTKEQTIFSLISKLEASGNKEEAEKIIKELLAHKRIGNSKGYAPGQSEW